MWNWDIHKYIYIHTYFLSSTFDFEACKYTTHSKVNSIYLLLCHISQASFSAFPRQWQQTSGFPSPSLLSILHTEAVLASLEHSCEHIHFLFKLPLASHLPRDGVQLSSLSCSTIECSMLVSLWWPVCFHICFCHSVLPLGCSPTTPNLNLYLIQNLNSNLSPSTHSRIHRSLPSLAGRNSPLNNPSSRFCYLLILPVTLQGVIVHFVHINLFSQ